MCSPFMGASHVCPSFLLAMTPPILPIVPDHRPYPLSLPTVLARCATLLSVLVGRAYSSSLPYVAAQRSSLSHLQWSLLAVPALPSAKKGFRHHPSDVDLA